jgi:hypothetical protein
MTTLYNWEVKRTKHYVVHHHVAGDLSHNYEVRTPSMVQPGDWGLSGTGIAGRNMKDVGQIGKLIQKHGYSRAYEIWQKKIMSPKFSFGYLSDSKLAKKLAPMAYGDYAEKIMKKYRLKRR